MASRILSQGAAARAAARAAASSIRSAPVVAVRRSFGTSLARLDAAVAAGAVPPPPLPARRPIGGLRGGLFGFFLGSTLAALGVYYYAIQEYKASNELLTEDIYALQNAVDRLSQYVESLEAKMEALEKRKK